MLDIKQSFKVIIAVNLLAALFLAFCLVKLKSASLEVQQANAQKYNSYLLADELRQSSDDLTRLGRTYVVTGDQSYKQQYMDILDIRDGKKARPQSYHRIYWDFVAASNTAPRKNGEKAPLLELMKQAGFTNQEFEKLNQAKANSDGLVKLEVLAMNLVEGKDEKGNVTGIVDRQKAIELVHSKQYHSYKSDIMKPIDEFYVLMEQRINNRLLVADNSSNTFQILTYFATGFLILSMMAMAAYSFVRIISSLSVMKEVMNGISEGKLDTENPLIHRNDEVGIMAKAIDVFRANAIRNKELEQEQLEQKEISEKEKAKFIEDVIDQFNAKIYSLVESFSTTSEEMNNMALTLNETSSKTSHQSEIAATSAKEATANVQSVATATEEIYNSIGEINTQITKASDATKQAVKVVSDTGEQIAVLSATSNKIGEVISMISEIAEQTNLLALNATIEAARAGEAGKGFAIVASEVKALSTETAKATDDISNHINEIQKATNETVTSIDDIKNVITQLEETSTVIASAMEEQAASTQDVTRNIAEAASGTEIMTSNIESVAQAAQQTGDVSTKVNTSSQDLSEKAELMKAEINKFLDQLRAA